MAALLRHRRALPNDERLSEAARVHIAGNARLTPVEQLEIYREQFWLRHTAALLDDFPGLSGILGQTDWERLVESYLEEVAPTSWTLRDLGARMPAHVERSTWLPHHELCVDMATLEWAHVTAFDAEDAAPLDPAKLQGLGPEAWLAARLVLAPSLVLLRVQFPVAELRRRLRDASDASDANVASRAEPALAIALPGRAPQGLVVHRGSDLALHDSRPSDVAFELLVALHEGLPLVQACERAAERVPDGAEELERSVTGWFTDWAKRGWVVDVQTP
jgi:hypothetical protein